MKLTELPTPCFVVDINKVRSNAKRMIKNCADLGVSLRPHTKTHKTVEIAELQTDGKKRGIAVSTLAEAEMYADAGFDDILLAYPITEEKIKRCIKLTDRLEKFIVMISDLAGLKCLQKNEQFLPAGKRWSVVIELDTGYKRSGFDSTDSTLYCHPSLEQAAAAVVNSMNLVALYCHCGASYDLTSAKDREQHNAHVVHHLDKTRDSIIRYKPNTPPFLIGTGSTPACSLSSDCHKRLDEFHPGNYIFYDVQHYLLNACRPSDIAGRVMTRVVAHKPEEHMVLIDCGFLAVSLHGMDEFPQEFCVFEGEYNLKVTGLCQELGKVKAKTGDLDCRLYPVGTILFILPYHSCSTAAMHPVYHIHDGDEVTGTWTPVKGW